MDEVLALFDRHREDDLATSDERVERDGPVTRIWFSSMGFIASPADTGLRGPALDDLIVRQRDRFAAEGSPVEWKTYGYDQPADLPTRLIAAGFIPDDRETLMIGDATTMSGLGRDATGVSIRETVSDDDLVAIGFLHSEVWGTDGQWVVDHLRDSSRADGGSETRVLVAEADGRIVAAAWLVMNVGSPFAGLWGGSTLAAYRSRGIYRALVARRAAIAGEAGYRYLRVDASDMSRPILDRLGFAELTTTTPYVWRPTAESSG